MATRKASETDNDPKPLTDEERQKAEDERQKNETPIVPETPPNQPETQDANAEEEPIAYRFAPRFDGEFLRGVPARDLTESEFEGLPVDIQRDATYELEPVEPSDEHPGHPGRPALYQAIKQ